MPHNAEKIRLAYLIDTMDSDKGGTEKQLLNIIAHLDPSRFEVVLVCLYQSPWMEFNTLPCRLVTLNYRGFLKPNLGSALGEYRKLLETERFHVVQTFFEDAMFFAYLGRIFGARRHALVVSRRDLGLGEDEPFYHFLYRRIRPLVFSDADGVAVNAGAIREHLIFREKVAPEKITVICNGLDLPDPPSAIPSLFAEHHADLWVGIVANLKPVKRIDLFLQALAIARRRAPELVLRGVIIGDDRLRVQMRQLAEDLGVEERTHFVGSIANVTDYLQRMDVGVLCSDKEGLSNAILEYMACGLPVVATAVGGNGELVDDLNGVCVPPGDAEALADAILALARSREHREELGHGSRIKVLERYTWDKIISQWESYYSRIAAGRWEEKL